MEIGIEVGNFFGRFDEMGRKKAVQPPQSQKVAEDIKIKQQKKPKEKWEKIHEEFL